MKIGIVVAITEEAERLARTLGLSLQEGTRESYHLYTDSSQESILITPGENNNFLTETHTPIGRPGKVSAGIVTTLLIEKYSPDVIINCGTAAGIASKGTAIGDIVVADFVTNHDVHIPLPGYDAYGERKIPLHTLDIFGTMALSYMFGTISSSESFTATQNEWNRMKKSDVLAQEMEAAGVMQAVEILSYRNPVYIVKVLDSIIHENTADDVQTEDYSTNFANAMTTLATFIAALVSALRAE